MAVLLISGSSRLPMVSSWSTPVTLTPSRWKAWPSSRPITPRPITARDSGKVSSSKISSVVRMRSPNTFQSAGTMGVEPVAMTIRLARIRRSPTCRRPGSINCAYSGMNSSPISSVVAESTLSTKMSRRSCTCSMASAPSTLSPSPPSMPSRGKIDRR